MPVSAISSTNVIEVIFIPGVLIHFGMPLADVKRAAIDERAFLK
jgi:hypothetical protein